MKRGPEWVAEAEKKVREEELAKEREALREKGEAERKIRAYKARKLEREKRCRSIIAPFVEIVNQVKEDLRKAGYVVSPSTKLTSEDFEYYSGGKFNYCSDGLQADVKTTYDSDYGVELISYSHPYGVVLEIIPGKSVLLYVYRTTESFSEKCTDPQKYNQKVGRRIVSNGWRLEETGIKIIKEGSSFRKGRIVKFPGYEDFEGFRAFLRELVEDWMRDGYLEKVEDVEDVSTSNRLVCWLNHLLAKTLSDGKS